MNELREYTEKIFEDIKHIDDERNEYWYGREIMPLLGYKKWDNFQKVLKQSMISCENSNISVLDHFLEVKKMVDIGSKTKRKISDYKLSRYACYLIAQNGDSRKKSISLAQTYFAIQTRKQELLERYYNTLSEDEKRIYQRFLTRKGNLSLNKAAKDAGVKNFDKFHNAGYKGLYNGETADDIAKRKGLRYREEILDNMGSEELVDNLFRIVQTEQKLKREKIRGEQQSNDIHYTMGKDIRGFIKKQGGTMPEDLPTPKKSLKELEKGNSNIKKSKGLPLL